MTTLNTDVNFERAVRSNTDATIIGKKADLASLGKKLLDRDGQVIPFSSWGTDVNNSEYIMMAGEDTQIMQVGSLDLSGRPQAGGNDSHDYIVALEDSLNDTFNDGEFQSAVQHDVFPCEFRPFGTDPTPIRQHLLEDRTVRFTHNGKFNPAEDAPTAKAISGSAVMVTPVLNAETNKSGILVSAATMVSDFDMMGGWTHGSLMQSVHGLIDQYIRKAFSAVAKVLSDTPDLVTIKDTKLSGKPQDIAETLLDSLSINLPTHLGQTLGDFALMVPVRLNAILERAAHKAGHEEISELLGCTVCPYDGEDTGVYILPKTFCAFSFRSTAEGDTVKVVVTRDSAKSAYTLELLSVVDVMATGTVKVKHGQFNTEADASFPLVTRIQFTEAE